MWALVTELLFSFVLLAFLVISCQNVLHIASGSVRSVLTYIHIQLDYELGEVEGVADEEENVTTRVVRRRVILKVQSERRRSMKMFNAPSAATKLKKKEFLHFCSNNILFVTSLHTEACSNCEHFVVLFKLTHIWSFHVFTISHQLQL